MGCAVIGSSGGVAMVDNAGGIRKSFIKSFINGIFVVQTNLKLHTMLKISGQSDPDLQRCLRHTHSHSHTHTHTHTHRAFLFQ